MKQLGVFLLPPGWDASLSQGYPPALNLPVPIYTWVERGTARVKGAVSPNLVLLKNLMNVSVLIGNQAVVAKPC